jgi:prolyl 4-hydroxylase
MKFFFIFIMIIIIIILLGVFNKNIESNKIIESNENIESNKIIVFNNTIEDPSNKSYIVDEKIENYDEKIEHYKKMLLEKNNNCTNENCQNCTNQIADINEEYILPTIHENIITDEEAKYIINKSTNNFKDSIIVSGLDSNIRKSKTAWLNKFNPVVKSIILRVCKITNSPFENAEHLQVVKYDTNGFYNEHFDTVTNYDKSSQHFLRQGGHRIITMLIYLNDEFSEGETRFPILKKKIKPPKHSGILFYTLDKNLKKCHPKALHAGLPIKSGHKYIANVWIRQNPYPHDPTNNDSIL